MWRSFLTRWSC